MSASSMVAASINVLFFIFAGDLQGTADAGAHALESLAPESIGDFPLSSDDSEAGDDFVLAFFFLGSLQPTSSLAAQKARNNI
jgi:hypothetical protein